VRQVACRLAVSRFRRVQLGNRLLPRTDVVPELDATRVALVAALRQIPEAQRLAIVLHHVADLSVEEVARETGVPVGTVKARLSRGRAALALLLSDSEDPR
jgi:RNA polymerase sigma-70 factor (ECF subfamily)